MKHTYQAIQAIRAAIKAIRASYFEGTISRERSECHCCEYRYARYAIAELRQQMRKDSQFRLPARGEKRANLSQATPVRYLGCFGDKVAQAICSKFPINLKKPDTARFTAYKQQVGDTWEVAIYDHAKKKQLFTLHPGFKLYNAVPFVLNAAVVRTSGCGKVYRVKILTWEGDASKGRTPPVIARTRVAYMLAGSTFMNVREQGTTADQALTEMTDEFTRSFISRAETELAGVARQVS